MTVPDAHVARWQRSLLPGGLTAGADAPRSPRDWAIDVLLSVVAVAVGTVLIAIQHYDDARWMFDAALGARAASSRCGGGAATRRRSAPEPCCVSIVVGLRGRRRADRALQRDAARLAHGR